MKTGRFFLLIAFLSGTASFAQAQQITEEDYRQQQEAIWAELDRLTAQITAEYEKYPEKQDSLNMATYRVLDAIARKAGETALQYAFIPEALEDMFRLRNFISKDTLGMTLKRLPAETQRSFYGKCLQAHLDAQQVEEGGVYYDFPFTDLQGNQAALSSLAGRNILLVCGGLGCMQGEGRAYLDKIYRETSRDDFLIVVYCFCENPDELRQAQTLFDCKYLLVSDFRRDDGPVKINYGVQTLPTCFFIDRSGIVTLKTEGVDQEKINNVIRTL